MKNENGKNPEMEAQTEIPVEKIISIGQIDLSEEYRLRESDDSQTIMNYTEIYQEKMEDGVLSKNPFPPCVGYCNADGKFIPTAGRHRIIAGKEAGVKEFDCIVYRERKSAIWHGLGDNSNHGLPNRPGDRKKMIEIAWTNFPISNRAIAELIGCSSTYVDQIAKQLQTGLQLPKTKTGRDGKQYPPKKPRKKPEQQPSQTHKEPEGDEIGETTENIEVVKPETPTNPASETENIETVSATESKGDNDSTENSPVPSKDETLPPSPAVVPLITPNNLLSHFKNAVESLTITDQQKVNFFQPFIVTLFGSFKDKQYRLEFLKWVEAQIEKWSK